MININKCIKALLIAIRRSNNTYKHFVANSIFQFQLQCDLFQSQSVVCLHQAWKSQQKRGVICNDGKWCRLSKFSNKDN